MVITRCTLFCFIVDFIHIGVLKALNALANMCRNTLTVHIWLVHCLCVRYAFRGSCAIQKNHKRPGGQRAAQSVRGPVSADGQDLGAPGPEGAAEARQTGTVLGAKVLAVHVRGHLVHPQAELRHCLVRPGASEVVVEEAADVADGRLVRVDIGEPGAQPLG